jgi:endo-1,4-beta-xylanase
MTVKAHTRREFLGSVAALGATTLSGMSSFATAGTAAAAADRARSIPYGSAVRAGALATDVAYRQAIVANCDIIVPEGEMKWPDVHPARNRFDFEKADALMDFARQHTIEIRGHTLAWYGGMPDWTNEIASRAEAERELVGHIETLVSRYRGDILSWDVVNEPLIDWPEDANSLRPSIWTRQLGPDYIPIALKTTAQADPGTRLVLNEYDVEYKGDRFAARRKALLQLLRSLRDRDVPLHAVGLQSHLFGDRALDRDALQAFLREIVALKLDVLITELDVIDYEFPADIGERDARVAATARAYLESVCEVVHPKALLTWGLTDRYTWVPTWFKRRDGLPNRPLPLDADLKAKPLFDVIKGFRQKSA